MSVIFSSPSSFRSVSRLKRPRCNQLLAPLYRLARVSDYLFAKTLGAFSSQARHHHIPRFIFLGPTGGGEPIRIGIFAGIHGDESEGVEAVAQFLQHLEENPELARGFQIYVYPICNPTGFEAGTRLSVSGKDLNREFWKNSSEPEVQYLEKELREGKWHGLISLHADDTTDGVYGFVKGSLLTEELLNPALEAAEIFLPRARTSMIDGFPAKDGIIYQCYDGVLTGPSQLTPTPFEIIFETPQRAARALQVQATVAALKTILEKYRAFLAIQPNI
ncbi:MAG: succinylglutamate desuccinylase/aspartoacylase family protein [Verrucomicrobiae bacterium]|nr:succinylglutamate desuccinylase/aspartoacylase family protein [Verrucomicrobiae bacterium]